MLPAPLKVLPQKFLGIETHPIGTSKRAQAQGPGHGRRRRFPVNRTAGEVRDVPHGIQVVRVKHGVRVIVGADRSRRTGRGGITIAADLPRDVPVAPLSGLGEGDCHASCHKGTIGFSVNFGALRCRLRPGRRQRRYGRRRRHSGRQWRWTRWNWNNNSKWKRHYRFNIHDVAPEHNGNIVRRCAAENECGKDGRACLSQRNKETLLRTLRSPLAATRLPLLATDSKRRHHAHYTSLRLSK